MVPQNVRDIFLRGDIKGFTDLQLTLDVYFDVVYFMFDILLDLLDLTYTLTLFQTPNLTKLNKHYTIFPLSATPPPSLNLAQGMAGFLKVIKRVAAEIESPMYAVTYKTKVSPWQLTPLLNPSLRGVLEFNLLKHLLIGQSIRF